MNYGNIQSHLVVDEFTTPRLPLAIDGASVPQPTDDQLWRYRKSLGWRRVVEVQPDIEGFRTLLYNVEEIDGDTCRLKVIPNPTSIADEQAAQQAADEAAAYQASLPVQFPTGIEASVVVLVDADGKGLGVVASDGELVTYLDHASPRPDAATIEARQTAARQERRTRKNRINAIDTDLAQVKTAIDGIDKTAFPAGAQRQSIAALITVVENLRQALSKMQKELK